MRDIVFKRILIIPISILIIIGVVIMGFMLDAYNRVNSITVDIETGETQLVKFDRIGLVPGESCEYTIKFKGGEDLDLSLAFAEGEEKSLKNFAFVKIIAGDVVILDELLADVFEHEEITLSVNFNEKRNTEITIIYYLPIEVGNEAKNAEADFDLVIRADQADEK